MKKILPFIVAVLVLVLCTSSLAAIETPQPDSSGSIKFYNNILLLDDNTVVSCTVKQCAQTYGFDVTLASEIWNDQGRYVNDDGYVSRIGLRTRVAESRSFSVSSNEPNCTKGYGAWLVHFSPIIQGMSVTDPYDGASGWAY